jgi:hypothetical protein
MPCFDCENFKPTENTDYGECRAHPPTCSLPALPEEGNGGNGAAAFRNYRGRFPLVPKDCWCGQWRADFRQIDPEALVKLQHAMELTYKKRVVPD